MAPEPELNSIKQNQVDIDIDLVKAAITALDKQIGPGNGHNKGKIFQHIKANYKLGETQNRGGQPNLLKRALRQGMESGILLNTNGNHGNGPFKLARTMAIKSSHEIQIIKGIISSENTNVKVEIKKEKVEEVSNGASKEDNVKDGDEEFVVEKIIGKK